LILIPQYFYSTDSLELGKALIAWRYGLSREEVVLLTYIGEGLTNEQIAEQMASADETTIKSRITRLYIKLGATGRIGATVMAVQFGLIRPKVATQAP
jgi:DNA-binding NarL/FixJ family response regulator